MRAYDWYQNHRPWATLNDLEGQKCTFFAEKMRFLEPTAQMWIKIDPYNLRQNCSPMILVSGNLGCMGIFAGVPLGGALKWECGGRRQQFLAIWMATSSESSGIRPAISYDDMLTLVGRQMTAKKNDLDWLWVAICRENPFLASTLLQQRCVFWSPLHKFEWR